MRVLNASIDWRNKMKYLVVLLMLTGCTTYRMVTPNEALLMCGGKVLELEAIVGKVVCQPDFEGE